MSAVCRVSTSETAAGHVLGAAAVAESVNKLRTLSLDPSLLFFLLLLVSPLVSAAAVLALCPRSEARSTPRSPPRKGFSISSGGEAGLKLGVSSPRLCPRTPDTDLALAASSISLAMAPRPRTLLTDRVLRSTL